MKHWYDVNDTDLDGALFVPGIWVAVAYMSYGSIPCDHFLPEFQEVAAKWSDKMKLFRLDVDENPAVTRELKISAVPTLAIYWDGSEVKRFEGPYSHERIDQDVRLLLNPKKRKGKR